VLTGRLNPIAALVIATMAVGTIACGRQLPQEHAAVIRVATHPSFSGENSALLAGRLSGDRAGALACFWIADHPDLPIIWPTGYSAQDNPLRVVDDRGRMVAAVGDAIRLGGSAADVPSHTVLGCGAANQAWLA